MKPKHRHLPTAVLSVVFFIGFTGHAESQFGWVKAPALTGGCSDPTTVNESTPFAYTIFGVDKDTFNWNGVQAYDPEVACPFTNITSISMGLYNINLQSEDAAAAKKTWSVSGNSRVVTESTIYYDEFRFDDPGTGKADDDPSPWYTKTVIVTNVP